MSTAIKQLKMDNDMRETQIRPYKWSCWDFEIYSRNREGKTEYAFITTEHKWVDIDIEGDYALVPIEQHELLAPLFKRIATSTADMYFVIDGLCGIAMAEGGYVDMEFSEPHLKTEYAKVEKQMPNDNYTEMERLEKMGFKEYEDKMNISHDYVRTVVKFDECQRELGE